MADGREIFTLDSFDRLADIQTVYGQLKGMQTFHQGHLGDFCYDYDLKRSQTTMWL